MNEPAVPAVHNGTLLEEAAEVFIQSISPMSARRTLITYRRALRLMCDLAGNCTLAQIRQALLQFRAFLQANYPPNTARTYAAAAGRFAAWAGEQLGCPIRQPSLPGRISPRFLSDQEMKSLREIVPDLPPLDQLIVHLLLLGLRPGEIVCLEPTSLLSVGSRPALEITYRRGRSERKRTIYVPEIVAALIRMRTNISPGTRIIPLTVRSVEARVRAVGRRIGIPDLSPMDIRWTRMREAIREYREKGMPVNSLRWHFGVSPMQWRTILEVCSDRKV